MTLLIQTATGICSKAPSGADARTLDKQMTLQIATATGICAKAPSGAVAAFRI